MASPSMIMVRATNSDDVTKVTEKLERVLFDLYGDEDLYNVTSREAMLETLGSVTDTLMIVLGGIAAISLVVGGIGIGKAASMNLIEALRNN